MDGLVLVVNAGSSSLKLSVIADGDRTPVASTTVDHWDGADIDALASFAPDQPVAAIGHRVVHGGTQFSEPVLLDASVRTAIGELSSLAPLHQPRALAGIDAAERVFSGTPEVACFDTSFHAHLPQAAATYAVPEAWRRTWPIRRFGFHGLSHAWAARRAAELVDRPLASLAMVTCHIGAGASLCAVDGGRSVDTTMGFTPLEGLVMATRSGSVDPGLVLWLLRQSMSFEELERGLEFGGGLQALAGTPDFREVARRRAEGDDAARLAFDVYTHRLCREVLGMTASLGRLDVLVFTGGVGEHEPELRQAVAERLAHVGVVVDEARNRDAQGDADITSAGAAASTVVVTAREDLEIDRQVRAVLSR